MNIYNQKKENTFIQEQKGPTYMQSTTSEYKAKEMSKHPQRERKKTKHRKRGRRTQM